MADKSQSSKTQKNLLARGRTNSVYGMSEQQPMGCPNNSLFLIDDVDLHNKPPYQEIGLL